MQNRRVPSFIVFDIDLFALKFQKFILQPEMVDFCEDRRKTAQPQITQNHYNGKFLRVSYSREVEHFIVIIILISLLFFK